MELFLISFRHLSCGPQTMWTLKTPTMVSVFACLCLTTRLFCLIFLVDTLLLAVKVSRAWKHRLWWVMCWELLDGKRIVPHSVTLLTFVTGESQIDFVKEVLVKSLFQWLPATCVVCFAAQWSNICTITSASYQALSYLVKKIFRQYIHRYKCCQLNLWKYVHDCYVDARIGIGWIGAKKVVSVSVVEHEYWYR